MASDPPEAGAIVADVVIHVTWVLGTEPKLSRRRVPLLTIEPSLEPNSHLFGLVEPFLNRLIEVISVASINFHPCTDIIPHPFHNARFLKTARHALHRGSPRSLREM